MSWYHSIAEDGTGCWLAIESAGMPLGALGLNNICHTNKKAEIGYWLLPQHWGKGVMRKALPGLLFYAFSDLKIHRISAEVEVENIKSQRLLQALGFTLEGISRECEIKEGRYISLMNYSLLSHEERLKPVVG